MKKLRNWLRACGICFGTGTTDNGDDTKECPACQGKGMI
jgi:DnaJ-class molecular chaperone